MTREKSALPQILKQHESSILNAWMKAQLSAASLRKDVLSEPELREQSVQLLRLITEASESGSVSDISTREWAPVRELLAGISGARAIQGFSPSETATFVFSLKQPLFACVQRELSEVGALVATIWAGNVLLDKLGLYTVEVFQKSREELIARQQAEMIEISTPVVKLWEGILALPMIGTLDSERTQVVMETLLQRIVETGSEIAIIDITGVLMVDTLVAQHLLKTVAAARLMGADCIISGIRPQIAQTMVHLAIDLSDVTTKASLADAFRVALQRKGATLAIANLEGSQSAGASSLFRPAR